MFFCIFHFLSKKMVKREKKIQPETLPAPNRPGAFRVLLGTPALQLGAPDLQHQVPFEEFLGAAPVGRRLWVAGAGNEEKPRCPRE